MMNNPAVLTSSSNKEVISWKQRIGMSLFCTGIFLFIYALTIGPVVKLLKMINVSEFEIAFKYFYAPIVFLVEKDVEPFASALKWYISFFVTLQRSEVGLGLFCDNGYDYAV